MLAGRGLDLRPGEGLPPVGSKASSGSSAVVPTSRVRYLADIADTVRGLPRQDRELADSARRIQHLSTARAAIAEWSVPRSCPA